MIDINQNNFEKELVLFLEEIIGECDENGVKFSKYSIDHVCYRVETNERYAGLKKYLDSFAQCLVESIVGGRLISTYKFNKPIIYKDFYINILELPAPKDGSSYKEGFEHIEIVSTGPLSFKKRKAYNSELKVKLPSYNIKWHYQSLESVVRLEKNTSVFNALIDSKILVDLEEFDPLVAGTFPLGLDLGQDQSDLDILVGGTDLKQLFNKVLDISSKFSSVTVKRDDHFFTINFEFQSILFEIYAEAIPSVLQRAYQHFLVEEKVLRVGSAYLYESILVLRKKGVKTEPAFAEVLNLSGDPYVELLNMLKLSDKEVFSFLKDINSKFIICDTKIYE